MSACFLGLIPDYELIVVFLCVFCSCLAIPLPSSMLTLAAGSFAAIGDLPFRDVLLVPWCAYLLGDQCMFQLGRRQGDRVIQLAHGHAAAPTLLQRSQLLLDTHGVTALLISHTLLSPTAPYVSGLCGLARMNWYTFTGVAALGAMIWTTSYVTAGYLLSNSVSRLSDLSASYAGMVLAVVGLILAFEWLRLK